MGAEPPNIGSRVSYCITFYTLNAAQVCVIALANYEHSGFVTWACCLSVVANYGAAVIRCFVLITRYLLDICQTVRPLRYFSTNASSWFTWFSKPDLAVGRLT